MGAGSCDRARTTPRGASPRHTSPDSVLFSGFRMQGYFRGPDPSFVSGPPGTDRTRRVCLTLREFSTSGDLDDQVSLHFDVRTGSQKVPRTTPPTTSARVVRSQARGPCVVREPAKVRSSPWRVCRQKRLTKDLKLTPPPAPLPPSARHRTT